MRSLLIIFFTCLWILGCTEDFVPELERRVPIPETDRIQSDTLPKGTIDTDTAATDTSAMDTVVTDTVATDTAFTEEETIEPEGDRKLSLIFDTDIAEDCDDVGAMAVLHALADMDEIDILGMMVSMPVEYGAPALDALNTYFNRPNIPIGTLKNSQDAAGAGNLLVYNKALATQFPNDLKHADHAPNALDLYRKLLANEPDHSVVILTVGPLTNLYHLMKSSGDQYSSLNGMDLIKKKVKRFIMAGGKLPEGTSYNFRLSPEKSEYVINNWPTEHWLVPNELGDNVLTGNEMIANTSPDNPVHLAYSLYKKVHPGWQFRPSWDQMGVYIAARSNDGLFKQKSTGSVTANNQYIQWKASPDKNHIWFQNNSSTEERRRTIENLMMYLPANRR